MKIVRSILTNAEYDCVEESENYYIGKRSVDVFLYALLKVDYVEVKEEWKDVTKECDVISSGDDIVHEGTIINKNRGYRIEKIQCNVSGSLSYAFVVKKLVKR